MNHPERPHGPWPPPSPLHLFLPAPPAPPAYRCETANGRTLRRRYLRRRQLRRSFGSRGNAPAEGIPRIKNKSSVGGDKRGAGNAGNQAPISFLQTAFKHAADDALLSPDLPGREQTI